MIDRTCLWCGDPIPDVVLDIDEEAECCSVECMKEYGAQLIANYINDDYDQ